jgi:hypothetical protein
MLSKGEGFWFLWTQVVKSLILGGKYSFLLYTDNFC